MLATPRKRVNRTEYERRRIGRFISRVGSLSYLPSPQHRTEIDMTAPNPMPDDDDAPIGRRRFFRAGLKRLLKPLAQVADTASDVANHLAKLDDAGDVPAKPTPTTDPKESTSVRAPDGETSARSASRPPPRRVD